MAKTLSSIVGSIAAHALKEHKGGKIEIPSLRFTISQEILAHFQCGLCLKWWSIGEAPEREYWYCPWCGEKLKNG